MHLSFGEKRSTDGSLLKYNVFNQTKIITEEIYHNITKLENFAKLKKDPNLIFIEIYLKKIIFDKVYYNRFTIKNN